MFEERRNDGRTNLSVPVSCKCFFNPKDEKGLPIESVTLNVSDSGLCLYSVSDLSRCYKIEVHSVNGVPRHGKVVWCRPSGDLGIYQAGISFRHEDDELVLRKEGLLSPSFR